MKERAKNSLINLLFRLLDTADGYDYDDKRVQQWLAFTWQDPGFRHFVRARDFKFMRNMAGGLGMSELARPDYARAIGQRFELLRLADQAKKAFKKSERERRERMPKPKK